MLEIYNETIRDSLSPRLKGGDGGGGAGKQYVIRHDADGNTSVYDLTIEDVCNIKEVLNLLQHAVHRRFVGKTDMNEHSSRSHFVFTLRIYGVNELAVNGFQKVRELDIFQYIVLSGGSTMFKDVHRRRLQREIKKIVGDRVLASEAKFKTKIKTQPVEVNVVSHPMQRHVAWFGGSIFGDERVTKAALKTWVVNAFRERKALALTLNDTKTAVNKLHQMVNVLAAIIIVAICLLFGYNLF